MLQRAGIDPAIIGDLVEEYAKGRSRAWFWMEAFGALVTKAPRPRYVTAARWLAALPLAMIAARLVIQISGLLFGRDSAQLRVRVAVALLIGAAFIVIGVAAVPGRKGALARLALGVVLAGSAGVSALMFLPGERFWTVPLMWGVCTVLGGATAYSLLRNRRTA
jgi:CHASE2 domain-containing sensor protein